MKTLFSIVFAVLVFASGIYLLSISLGEWIGDGSITVFTKGSRDLSLTGGQAWLAIVANVSLSLTLMLGAFSVVLNEFSSKGMAAIICKAVAGLLFLNFALFYAIILLFFY
ncbi:hypothetical protein [Marinicella sp. W31]|uniref:hypothetical protein n=1 Tax=Marinicella sp. W31 TaxID=3023713 RepID=UPI0037577B91